jgi:hypothetical protein
MGKINKIFNKLTKIFNKEQHGKILSARTDKTQEKCRKEWKIIRAQMSVCLLNTPFHYQHDLDYT